MNVRTRRAFAPLLTLAAATALAPPAAAEPGRHALVIGNAGYRNISPLRSSVQDATDMGAALGKLGFTVMRTTDSDLATIERSLADFAATVRPGDVALVYFAGHGVTGQREDGGRTDNYLLPVDIALAEPGDVPKGSRGLATILGAIDRAGVKLIIVDACRNNPFENMPAAGAPAAGLVQPAAASLRGAFIAFATAPGEYAIEEPNSRNGLFTGELLKRLGQPGASLSTLLADVSVAVERASGGDQVPFFVAGDAAAAGFEFKPGQPAVPDDPVTLDLRLQREALACGQPICLEAAAAGISNAAIRTTLLAQARAVRASDLGAGVAGVASAPPPTDLARLPPAVAAYVTQQRAQPDGARRIAQRFLTGADGFPKDEAEALRWLRMAADAGSGPAAFDLASAYHEGLPGVPKDQREAYRWIVRSASLEYPAAFGLGGLYNLNGWGGRKADPAVARTWFQAGHARGDQRSLLQFALSETTWRARAGILYRSTERGWPEGTYLYAETLRLQVIEDLRAGPAAEPGVAQRTEFALRYFKQAGEMGWPAGYRGLGEMAWDGSGVPVDKRAALDWFTKAADAGDRAAMARLARIYATGDGGIAVDCAAAERWARRAAVAGETRSVRAVGTGGSGCQVGRAS